MKPSLSPPLEKMPCPRQKVTIEKTDTQQIAFAVQKHKSHRCVGSVSKVLEAIRLQEAHSAALVIF